MTDLYAVIGNPIGHTKSPFIHGRFAGLTGQDLNYSAIEGHAESFVETVQGFFRAGGKGMNVTAPFKLQAFEMADERSERARLAGAVNALKYENGRIHAENFDGIGLLNDIQRNIGLPFQGKRVLVLGAGGAARGALLPFLQAGPAELVVCNRTHAKAQGLAGQFAGFGPIRAETAGQLAGRHFDIVINATSASLRGELPEVPSAVFEKAALAYELAYGKGLTPFLKQAQQSGAQRLADGVGMLVEQAAEAFVWWRGVRPETAGLIGEMTIPLI
ncbi:shikimate dehydrogenase [Herbaspirillum sp.]|uniref:shikimate dehydrogenase n=1 Tax=Herbaspirillum sp. TaxID=1890675 RepID=UPI001B1CE3E9|nr:shikimate dehydrogenase [Herbaspirillum sp.]MBO9535203.1 shikimate dehydrogenase [Herbaspirillum sp.]